MAIVIEAVGNGILFNGQLVDKQGWNLSGDDNRVVLSNNISGVSGSSKTSDAEVNGSTYADYEELYTALASVLFKVGGTGPGTGVQSVNGDTGPAVVLDATDVGAAPASHTHPASQISDSTATGRSVLTAASAAAARTAIGAGTSNLALGTSASTAAAGNHTHANATTSVDGFMASADKTKLDSIFTGAYRDIVAISGDTTIVAAAHNMALLVVGADGPVNITLDATSLPVNGRFDIIDGSEITFVTDGATITFRTDRQAITNGLNGCSTVICVASGEYYVVGDLKTL